MSDVWGAICILGNNASSNLRASVTLVGTWTGGTTTDASAVNNNYQTHIAATSTDSFTWKVALPAIGKYYFQARLTGSATARATNAPYTITATDGISTKLINQTTATSVWVNLGLKTNSTAGNVATVKLGTASTGVVFADMVQAVPVAVTTTVNYLFADHLNTPRVITRASDNQMVWRWDNADPFGVNPPNTNPAGLGVFTYNPRFPGQVYDSETGLYYNVNRSYDPNIGGYTQSDPIGLAGGVNTYGYVGGNPVKYVDPTGQFIQTLPIICAANPLLCAGAGGIIICTLTNCIKPPPYNSGDDNVIPGPWPIPGEGDNSDADSKEPCPPDDGDSDCKEWRQLLVLQGDTILSNFINRKISLTEFNNLVKEHNQAVDFYIIECNDPSSEKALKL